MDGYLGGGAEEPGNFTELVRGTRKSNVRAEGRTDRPVVDGRGRADVIWRSCPERRSAPFHQQTPFSHNARQSATKMKGVIALNLKPCDLLRELADEIGDHIFISLGKGLSYLELSSHIMIK